MGDRMRSVMFLGIGRVGLKTLQLFKELISDSYIYALDKDPSLKEVVSLLDGVEFHVYSDEVFEDVARKVDLAVTALPASNAFRIVGNLVRKCVDVVDVSFFPEDPYELRGLVDDCGSVFVPDAGFAPGYSNLIVGDLVSRLNDVESIDIMVGGIPAEPIPPLGYVVTWNPSDLIEEYVRPARIVERGLLKYVDPLESVIKLDVEGVGVLEGFISDGLRTLINNVKVRNMREVTLRWPGHIGGMKLLRDLGLMSKEPIRVGDVYVRPSDVLAELLALKLSKRVDDIAIINVVATYGGGSKRSELAVLRGSPESPATPTFTALTHAYTAKLAYDGILPKGIHPLEDLSQFKRHYDEYLRSKGVILRSKEG